MGAIAWLVISAMLVTIFGLVLRLRRQSRMLTSSETQIQQATDAFGASMILVMKMQEHLREADREEISDKILDSLETTVMPPILWPARKLHRRYQRRKKLEAIDQEVQVIHLKWEPPKVLDHSARASIAKDIGWKYVRKSLKVGRKQETWLALYCMEAAKETSMLFGRGELLDFSLNDLKRALDRVHQDLTRIGATKLTADKIAASSAALSDTRDVRSFYHIALAAYGVLEANPLRVLWHLGILVFPTSRVKNAAVVYIAARLAFYLYSGEDQTHE